MSPTARLCGAAVWIVAVVPDELAPAIAGVAVPPPDTGRPVVGARVLEGPCGRHRGDRERAVVARDGDAGDRHRVADLHRVRASSSRS